MPEEPTVKQTELLAFATSYIKENDNFPTVKEISNHFGFKSHNTVAQKLDYLRAKGYLEYVADTYKLKRTKKCIKFLRKLAKQNQTQ